jgi:hypothetical protein
MLGLNALTTPVSWVVIEYEEIKRPRPDGPLAVSYV